MADLYEFAVEKISIGLLAGFSHLLNREIAEQIARDVLYYAQVLEEYSGKGIKDWKEATL